MLALSFMSASVTEGLVNVLSEWVRDGGLLAIFGAMAISAACIPIPSEVVMLFAGFAVADPVASGAGAHHHLTMLGVIVAGVLGSLAGSLVAYGVGRVGRLELLERHGHLVHMGPRQVQRADEWFRRFGEPIVLFGRLVPLIRAFVSLPAGVAKMGIGRFVLLTTIGSTAWVVAFAYAGNALGDEWKSVRRGFEYVDYVLLALLIAGVGYAIVRRRRARGDSGEPVADALD